MLQRIDQTLTRQLANGPPIVGIHAGKRFQLRVYAIDLRPLSQKMKPQHRCNFSHLIHGLIRLGVLMPLRAHAALDSSGASESAKGRLEQVARSARIRFVTAGPKWQEVKTHQWRFKRIRRSWVKKEVPAQTLTSAQRQVIEQARDQQAIRDYRLTSLPVATRYIDLVDLLLGGR
jgi:hypothetical protein